MGEGSWKKSIGVGLVALSGIWFALIFLVQLMALALATRVILSTVFFLLMESTFYLGLFLVGKQIASRYLRSIRLRLARSHA